jgi:hypothetical protein
VDVHRDDHNPGRQGLTGDPHGQIDAIEPRHGQVGQHDVGPQGADLAERLRAVARLGHDFDPGEAREESLELSPDQPVVISHGHANRSQHFPPSAPAR